MEKKLCCFIVPYFGKLPNYFQLFLNSCGSNPGYNWLIITDDDTPYVYPKNVQLVKSSFEELQTTFSSKFDFDICLPKPYKLCDFKPAYGYLFSEYLKDYEFWGHCDIDTIMGCLENFIPKDFLFRYDKVFCLGHMTIYRNEDRINKLFMLPYKGRSLYKLVFQNPKICVFDEEFQDGNNVNRMFIHFGKKVYMHDASLNFSTKHRDFRKITFNGINDNTDAADYAIEPSCTSLTVWDNGHLFRYLYDKTISRREYPYVHLQQRKMTFNKRVFKADRYKIVPNRFDILEVEDITICSFKQICLKSYDIEYYKYLIRRIYKAIMRRLKLIKENNDNYEIDDNHTRL